MGYFRGLRVLVTGGAGMIGSNLVKALVSEGATVTVADNLWRGRLKNLEVGRIPVLDLSERFLKVDLTDPAACKQAVRGQEIVYHLADVVAGISYVFANQASVFHTNVLINTNTLAAAIEMGVPKYIYVGTACSYPAERQSKIGNAPLKEEEAYPANPESSYGWSKLMGEYECEVAQRELLVKCGIIRLHNVYGPPCEMSPERSQVIPALIRKALRYPHEEFAVWGSGTQRRAFVYTDDVVSALLAAPERAIGKGPIQIGPDFSTSIREVAETILRLTGKQIEPRYQPNMREGDVDRAADFSKAKTYLDWEPRVGLEEGLRRTIEWCRKSLEERSS
jgi:nucleoside-diphosphate-sugar epimerase